MSELDGIHIAGAIALAADAVLGFMWLAHQHRIDTCPECPHCQRIKRDKDAEQQRLQDEYERRFYGRPLSEVAEEQRVRRKPHDKVRGRGRPSPAEDDPEPVGDEVGVDATEGDRGD